MPIIFLIFVLTPLVEIWLFLQVGHWIGIWPTLVTIVITAAIGVSLLRIQGMNTLLRARTKLSNQAIPAEEIGEGILLAVAGALLLTPGFFTDAVGFLLLVRPLRLLLIRRWIAQRIVRYRSFRSGEGEIIEGEFYRNEEKDQLGP